MSVFLLQRKLATVISCGTLAGALIPEFVKVFTSTNSRHVRMHAPFLLGLIAGGAIIYWFAGASAQAVTTGAYRAAEFIKRNIKLDTTAKASVADSKKVVAICTQYAQKGMFNIFLVVFFTTLSKPGVLPPERVVYSRTGDIEIM